MSKKIGPVLARTFREICEDSNSRARADHSKISVEEITRIEGILEQVDNERFDLIEELKKFLELEELDD
ncbi:MAG: hypothetical protein GF308_21260 [Candidatus Heimdallarchaeota archaeon]|nr:hypothetical protein [Candidatus Heimdallarchaeota archaeon]